MKYLDSTGLAYFWQKVKSTIEEELAAMPSDSGVPAGTIVIWSGEAGAIPGGWALCNGENGTPDLRGRFVLGGGGTYSTGATGGSEEVALTIGQMPSHYHDVVTAMSSGLTTSGGGTVLVRGKTEMPKIESSLVLSEGNTAPHPNMPPYYALCYIMKL